MSPSRRTQQASRGADPRGCAACAPLGFALGAERRVATRGPRDRSDRTGAVRAAGARDRQTRVRARRRAAVVPRGTRASVPRARSVASRAWREHRGAPIARPERRVRPARETGYSRAAMPTAGILVIGNEILSGKVVDTNSPYLCRELRALGVDVERIVTIPDVIDVIADHVRSAERELRLRAHLGRHRPDPRRPHDRGRRGGLRPPARAQRIDPRAHAARDGGNEPNAEPAQDGADPGRRDAARRRRPVVPARRRRERLHLPRHPGAAAQEVRVGARSLPRRARSC